MALMTISEVKTAAYTRKVDDNQFKDSDIEMAQFKYIRPILTENLYNAVVADTASYTTLITSYIKPCLAYYVKYMTFESFYSEISDRGINHLTGDNFQTSSNAARTDLKNEVLEKARILAEKLTDYVTQRYHAGDSLYTLYGNTTDVYSEKKIIGGFLLEDNSDIEDIEYIRNIRRIL